jgi:hypothetical protein
MENHWLRKQIEATGTKFPVEVSYIDGGRVRIEMDENETQDLIGPSEEEVEGQIDAVSEERHAAGYHEGQAEGWDEGYGIGNANGRREGIKEVLTELLLAARDGRLDECLKDTALTYRVSIP